MPTLDSISLDLSLWSLNLSRGQTAVWTDKDGDLLGVSFLLGKPDIPPLSAGVDALRIYFRKQCADLGNGIVEVDVVTVHGVQCGRLLTKARQQPTGFSFQVTCIVPRQSFSYVIQLQCFEAGMTGWREAAVMMIEQPAPEYEVDPAPAARPLFSKDISLGRLKGWFRDPYDPQFDSIALRTLADQEKYDQMFPSHPLSRARQKFGLVLQTIRFGDDVLEAPPFLG